LHHGSERVNGIYCPLVADSDQVSEQSSAYRALFFAGSDNGYSLRVEEFVEVFDAQSLRLPPYTTFLFIVYIPLLLQGRKPLACRKLFQRAG
jgi:hypothetical protein